MAAKMIIKIVFVVYLVNLIDASIDLGKKCSCFSPLFSIWKKPFGYFLHLLLLLLLENLEILQERYDTNELMFKSNYRLSTFVFIRKLAQQCNVILAHWVVVSNQDL